MIEKDGYTIIRELTDKAIADGYSSSDAEWRQMALTVVYEMCLRRQEFTVNEVRDIIKSSPLKTSDNRAMGGVMQKAKALKWIQASGRSIPSKVGHLVPIQIWDSLIFRSESVPVPSATDKGRDYEVREATDGSFDCTCLGFRYRKRCSHIAAIEAARRVQPTMRI